MSDSRRMASQDQAEADLKQRGEKFKDAGDDVKDAFNR